MRWTHWSVILEKRRDMSRQARQQVMAEFTLAAKGQLYLDVCRNILEDHYRAKKAIVSKALRAHSSERNDSPLLDQSQKALEPSIEKNSIS